MRAVIFGAAPLGEDAFYQQLIQKEDVILCADGGLRHVKRLGLKPYRVIGDFDSIPPEEVPKEALVHPREKDDTDMALCLKYAIHKKWNPVLLLGGLSGRLDHTLANIHLLQYGLEHETQVELIDDTTRVLLIREETEIQNEGYRYLSVFPFGEKATGVTYEGLYYPLKNVTLTAGIPLGVSNFFSKERARISLSSGALLVILSR